MVTYPNGVVSSAFLNPGQISTNGQWLCKRCRFGGCDLKVLECGCFLHARCTPVLPNTQLENCPGCGTSATSLLLIPMNFGEIDEAKAQAAAMSPSSKRGKKRKNATIARLNPANSNMDEQGDGSNLRTGRWTTEETMYCDKLIEKFEKGHLPISESVKLNDFLAGMLKSKQSRLTKKMKNARLSAKTYQRTAGFITNMEEAKEFSQLEKLFFESIQCDMERAEIRFHVQKEWRELFSSYCVSMGQKLDADSWLSSVEEMDKRVSQAKDAARMARRKVLMGYALSQDSSNPELGVFIENSVASDRNNEVLPSHASSNSLSGMVPRDKIHPPDHCATSLQEFSSPFVGRVVQYIHRHKLPFEYVDAWVPSFVPNADEPNTEQKCRLCFAGFASTDVEIPDGGGAPVPITSQHHFDLLSFGEYSAKFSFDVGCGLPGRVYKSSVCSWEQGVANAPSHQFERCGGAAQWGIKTVLGVPVSSPNVGRIVVLLYSRHDRSRDAEMVRRITDEFTKLKPTPKWKLVVDLGGAPEGPKNEKQPDRRVPELLKLLEQNTPNQQSSPYAMYLPGFTMLRMLLTKQNKTAQETEMLSTILESYSSYSSSGRNNSETACLIARDSMMLYQSSGASQQQQIQIQSQMASHGQQGLTSRGLQQVGVQHNQQSQMMQQQVNRLQQMSGHSQASQPGMLHQPTIGGTQQNLHLSMLQKQTPTSQMQLGALVHQQPAQLGQTIAGTQQNLHLGMLQKQTPTSQGALVHQQPAQLGQTLQNPMATQNMMNSGAFHLQNAVAAGGQQPNPGLMGSAFHPPRQHHT